MTPTNRLRFVKRSAPSFVDSILSSTQQTILQQWWENEPTTYKDIGVTGEWRDVPTEVQTVPVEEQA